MNSSTFVRLGSLLALFTTCPCAAVRAQGGDAAAACVQAATENVAQPAVPSLQGPSEGTDVLLIDQSLARLRIVVEVAGRPLAAVWEDSFRALLSFADLDADGQLSEAESQRLPSPATVRQMLSRSPTAFGGKPPAWTRLDADGNQHVDLAEIAAFYRRAGLGTISVGIARPTATPALAKKLIASLDLDCDGNLSQQEWQKAPALLARLDRNDDETVDADELVPLSVYPGTTATTLLTAVGEGDEPQPAAPLWLLPDERSDHRWAEQLLRRRDKTGDGALDADECGIEPKQFAQLAGSARTTLAASDLVAWRSEAPTVTWQIKIGAAEIAPRRDLAVGRLRLELSIDPGTQSQVVDEARERLLRVFTLADANSDEAIDTAELAKSEATVLLPLKLTTDRNENQQIERGELMAWLDLQSQLAQGQVLVTVLDHPAGLFELVDTDHSGSLSRRELRDAWRQLQAADCVENGQFRVDRLPRKLVVLCSRGRPLQWLSHRPATAAAPPWFVAMDSNRDGDVSAAEFLDTPQRFGQLDADADGLLTTAEAAAIR